MSSLAVAAVDVAATRGRVVVGQFAGDRLTFTTAHEFPVNYVRFGDHCYWELGGIHEQILTGLRKARTAFPGLAGCGVDFWGCDHVLLGKGDRLLQPVHSYRDHRTGKILNVLSSTDREQLYAWTGIPPLLYNTSFQLAESLQTLPNLRDRIQRCLFLAEYINLLLTGEAINEISAVSSGQLLQLTRHQYSHETFNFFGIPADWFSGPAIAGRLLGRIRGIKDLDGLEVTLVPAHDTACAFEAMPSFGVSPLLVTGTTWILAGFRNRTPYDRPDGCYLGISNERCGDGSYRPTRILLGLWLVDRLLKSFDQVPASEQEWEQLHAAVQRVPHSRQVLSTFNPGLLNPVDMRQAIDEHLRAENRPLPATLPEYLRLVLDSLAHHVSGSARILRHAVETPFDHVVVSGALAHRSSLCQSLADSTGKTVVACPALGAAAGNIGYQLLRLGAVRDLDEYRSLLARHLPQTRYTPTAGSQPDFVI